MAAGAARVKTRLATARKALPPVQRCPVAPRSRRRSVEAHAHPPSQLRQVDGLAVETVGSLAPSELSLGGNGNGRRDPPLALRVCVLPGNPGVAAYYGDFVEALQLQLGSSAAVCALGLLGHSRVPLHARTFDLEEQVAHVVRFVDEASADSAAPLVLVGHSIGAWLALRVLQERPERVQCVAGLYPFLMNNSASRLQRVLSAAVKLRPLVWLVAQLMSLFAMLPVRLRRSLLGPVLRGVGGLEDTAVDITCDWLRAASVNNTCTLGAAEFTALAAEPDWAALRKFSAHASLFYGGVEDIWGPPHHAEAVRQNVPGMAVVEDAKYGHMFCTTPEGSRYVAAHTAALLRAMMTQVAQVGAH